MSLDAARPNIRECVQGRGYKGTQTGIDNEGIILIAFTSGGDYILHGIPKCGMKIACEAAKTGFGHDLCQLAKDDFDGIQQ